MKIYVMTDLEGVAGVMNFADWCHPDGRYYEKAKELLTLEVNAAVEGFFAAGADEVIVADGHGHGGLDPLLLDDRAQLLRGWPSGWPLLLDETYDAVAWVGQHAKAGTEYAHLAHTQSFEYVDLAVNGVSIGEFGQLALCASELGVRSILLSGDRAACLEARALVPGIETAEVKRGTTPGRGDGLPTEAYMRRNLSAVHRHPRAARRAIRRSAEQALRRMQSESFGLLDLEPPYERVAVFRGAGEKPRTVARESHPSSVIALMNLPYQRRPIGVSEPCDAGAAREPAD